MFWPILYTVLTTICAFLSLIFSEIKPVIDVGWMMTLGLITSFCVTFTLLPKGCFLSFACFLIFCVFPWCSLFFIISHGFSLFLIVSPWFSLFSFDLLLFPYFSSFLLVVWVPFLLFFASDSRRMAAVASLTWPRRTRTDPPDRLRRAGGPDVHAKPNSPCFKKQPRLPNKRFIQAG